MRTLIFLILLFCLFIFPTWAKSEFTLPTDYVISYTPLDGPDEFSKRWLSLVQPRLSVIREHILSLEESKVLSQAMRNKALQTEGKKLADIQDQLAKIELKQASSEKGKAYELFLEQEQVKGELKRLSKEKLPELPETLPLKLVLEEEPYTADFNFYSPDTALWIYGKAAPLNNGVYYVEYYAFNSLTNQSEVLLRQTFNEAQILDVVDIAVGKLRGLLLGRKWGSLQVSSTVSGTQYFLNNKEVVDPRMFDILSPGRYTLVVKPPGHKEESRSIEINSNQKTKIDFKPTLLPASMRLVESKPSQAAVYLDGEYIGKTPLQLNAGPGQILYIQLPEYQPVFFSMNEKPKLFFTLLNQGVDLQKEIDDAQTIFYTSLGIFVASLIVPITFFTMQRNLYEKALVLEWQGNFSSGLDARRMAETYGIVAWSTTGVSTGLLGWAIYQLVDYVRKSAQK